MAAAPPCQAAHESDWKPWQAKACPSLPAACRWHGLSPGTSPPLPPDSWLTARPAPAQIEIRPPDRHPGPRQPGLQRAEWPEGWHRADPGSAPGHHGPQWPSPASPSAVALPRPCRSSAGHMAPRHRHGAGAGGEGWLPAGCLCPMLPVPSTARVRHCPCPTLPALLPAAWVEVAFFPGWHLLASWSTKELFSSETLPWYAGIRRFGGLFRLAATVCNGDSIAGDLLFLAPVD